MTIKQLNVCGSLIEIVFI